MPRRVYWDSCAFIALLNQELGKINSCRAVWTEAQHGETTILTSFFSFAEVMKLKCEDGIKKPLGPENDAAIADLFRQEWVVPVVVDGRVGILARSLMRQHPQCRKPSDAIHLATALVLNVDEMHTFDGSDLLGLNGKVARADRVLLCICVPAVAAAPSPAPKPPDLFDVEP